MLVELILLAVYWKVTVMPQNYCYVWIQQVQFTLDQVYNQVTPKPAPSPSSPPQLLLRSVMINAYDIKAASGKKHDNKTMKERFT